MHKKKHTGKARILILESFFGGGAFIELLMLADVQVQLAVTTQKIIPVPNREMSPLAGNLAQLTSSSISNFNDLDFLFLKLNCKDEDI